MLECNKLIYTQYWKLWIHVAFFLHPLNLVLTLVINDVHPSCVGHSREDPHVLHFLRYCQFSNEGLITLMDAIIDCAVLYSGHATTNPKNGMLLSTLVVSGTYRRGVSAHTLYSVLQNFIEVHMQFCSNVQPNWQMQEAT